MNTAIIVAGGSGLRMGMKETKQFYPILGHPMLSYTVRAFEESSIIDSIVIVAKEDEVERCKTEIVDRYGFRKVTCVTPGGKDRSDSSYQGILACPNETKYVWIHDGDRPCIEQETILRSYEEVQKSDACVVCVPSKDSIRQIKAPSVDAGVVLDRKEIWLVQTPQVFSYPLIRDAFERYFEEKPGPVTDDTSVLTMMTGHKVTLVEGTYRNVKVTTQEDLAVIEAFLAKKI